MNTKIKYLVFLIAMILSVSSVYAVAIPGQSTLPSQSLPYNLKQATNLTPNDTVVIAVANPDDYKVIAIADIIANHINAPVLITPPDKLSIYVIESLQQQLAYGNITKAIVVGTDANTTSIATLIADIKEPLTDKNIEVINTIYASTPEELSMKAALYQWDTSSSIIVADGYVQADLGKAVIMSKIDDIPVIYEQIGYDSINNTAIILNTSTIYVTPAVDPEVQTLMTGNYTVNTSWHNTNLMNDLEDILASVQSTNYNGTFVVVKETDTTPYDPFFHAVGNLGVSNTSIVIADNSTGLGLNQTTYLTNTKPNVTVLIGNLTIAEETLANEIAIATGYVPWRVVYDNDVEKITELSLIANNYYYPVVITSYTQTNDTFTYKFKNIGFTDVVKFADYSLRVEFTKTSGTFDNSEPTPYLQNDTAVIYRFSDPIYPADYATLTFTASEGTNFTVIPKIMYNAYTLAGTVKPLQSFFDYLLSYFAAAQSWIIDIFNTIVGIFSVYIPLPSYAVTVIAGIVTFLILWTIVGFIAYVFKEYAFKSKVTQKTWYGPIVWVLRR